MADEKDGPDIAKARSLVELGPRVIEFLLEHVVKTGDNPTSSKAQKLLDEVREAETQG